MTASNQNIRAMTKAMNRHSAEREFVDWLKAGRAIAIERNGSIVPIARHGIDRWTQTQALEGINPFKQDLPEFYWQAHKAGLITFGEYMDRRFTS